MACEYKSALNLTNFECQKHSEADLQNYLQYARKQIIDIKKPTDMNIKIGLYVGIIEE